MGCLKWIDKNKSYDVRGKTYEEAKEKMDKILGITPPKIPLPRMRIAPTFPLPPPPLHISLPPKSIIKKLQSGRKLKPP